MYSNTNKLKNVKNLPSLSKKNKQILRKNTHKLYKTHIINRKCRAKEICGKEVLREIAYCYTEGSFCQQWLQAQIEKSQTYDIRPSNIRRNDFIESENSLQHHQQQPTSITTSSNSNTNDFHMNGKGYRGQEYEPLKLKCGIAPALRNNRRNMNNLLKIIGGKASRKGEWPWQVAIFNRYKVCITFNALRISVCKIKHLWFTIFQQEAFCGGTLIAPQWILTAAHCLRKVLYVRLGEHNLDFEDGTEVQFRVLRSYKHPSFDRRTVDSDIALLKWVFFSLYFGHIYRVLVFGEEGGPDIRRHIWKYIYLE